MSGDMFRGEQPGELLSSGVVIRAGQRCCPSAMRLYFGRNIS